jgi:hypothetical protein
MCLSLSTVMVDDIVIGQLNKKRVNTWICWAGTVEVHEMGALYRYLRDLARLHDRLLSGHGCSNTLNLLRVPREHELVGRRRSLAPPVDHMVGASKHEEPTIIEELRAFYGMPEDPDAQHLYSDASLLARESIRYDPKIVKIMQKLWHVYDSDGSGFIDEEEYVVINKLVQRVLMADFSPSKAETVAREDWAQDCGGYFELNYERFSTCWFQLADLWTSDISVESYYRFLFEALECMSFVEKVGKKSVRRLRPPHAIINLKVYRREKKKGRLAKARLMNTKGIWAMSLTSSSHKHEKHLERVNSGVEGVTGRAVEPPPPASDDPAGVALLEDWMRKQIAAGFDVETVKETLVEHAADAAPESGLAKAASSIVLRMTPNKTQVTNSPRNEIGAWRTTPEPAGLYRQPPPPSSLNSRPTSAVGGYRLESCTSITAEKVSYLANPKMPVSRTKESVMLEQKMAQMIREQLEAAVEKERQGQLQPQQTEGGSSATAASSVGQVYALGPVLRELPSVYGRHAVRTRPHSERGSRPRPSQTATAVTGGASSARGPKQQPAAADNNDDARWAEEWVTAQRQEAARVMAAREAAQAAQIVSMADIERGLQHITRPVPPAPALASAPAAAAADEGQTPQQQQQQQQPAATTQPQQQQSSRTKERSPHPKWGVGSGGSGSDGKQQQQLRTAKGRPLTPGGGWRDDSTKIQSNVAVPPTLAGAALVSESAVTNQETQSTGGRGFARMQRAGGATGNALPRPPSAAVLTQGGHVPGWLRYTTMLMRTMPLEQVSPDRARDCSCVPQRSRAPVWLVCCLSIRCAFWLCSRIAFHVHTVCAFTGPGFVVRDGT